MTPYTKLGGYPRHDQEDVFADFVIFSRKNLPTFISAVTNQSQKKTVFISLFLPLGIPISNTNSQLT